MFRPRVSVCLAAYNGERWLLGQLTSILHQLNENDELIIVDDASCDSTHRIVEELDDSRIILLRNICNIGINRSFERAISVASGEIIFLSDQDDLWHENKVFNVLSSFAEAPDVTLILSDAEIIDEVGSKRGYTYFEIRGKFVPGVMANIWKSKFLGCAMAFRSSLCQHFLPFPFSIPGHDMWIGVVNEWYGKTRFIEEPLIFYRRHGGNASPEKNRGVLQMLRWRFQLIIELFWRITKIRS
jgi:hypothetical protein